MKKSNAKCQKIIDDFEVEIQSAEILNPSNALDIHKGIRICQVTLQRLRHKVMNGCIQSIEDEICLFKTIKPHILGHLLFYNYLQKIFEQKPLSTQITLQTFLIKKLKRFNKYLRKNHIDYAYYQNNGTKYDELYFVRCNLQAEDYHSHPYSMVDSDFATSKDYLFANFIAHEKVIMYLEDELVKLKVNKKIRYKSQLEILKASPYNWSETKIALVELIYAIVYSGCINNGNVDVKELSATFCELFHVKDLDIYRSYIDLKYRKKNPTVFLDKMKECLIKKLLE